MGVPVDSGAPIPVFGTSGHACNATGNNRQFPVFEQIFKLKDVCCVPWQTTTRLPFTTSAVRQVTGLVIVVSTSNKADSGKTKIA
jgi:hypothetical protein